MQGIEIQSPINLKQRQYWALMRQYFQSKNTILKAGEEEGIKILEIGPRVHCPFAENLPAIPSQSRFRRCLENCCGFCMNKNLIEIPNGQDNLPSFIILLTQ